MHRKSSRRTHDKLLMAVVSEEWDCQVETPFPIFNAHSFLLCDFFLCIFSHYCFYSFSLFCPFSNLLLISSLWQRRPGSGSKQPRACSLGCKKSYVADNSISRTNREISLLGLRPKWEVSLQLFSIMRAEPSAKRPGLILWLDQNPEHTWQLEGLWALPSQFPLSPGTTREAESTSPGHLGEHRNAFWKLSPSPLTICT